MRYSSPSEPCAERRQPRDREELAPHTRRLAADDLQAPDETGAVVAVEVAADRRRDLRAAVDVAAGDGAAVRVRVLGDRRVVDAPRQQLRDPVVQVRALEAVPPEVRDRLRAALQVVDLLPRVLTDVADVEVAGLAVEAEAPRVPQAVRDERPARALGVDVQPHDLRERPREALPVRLQDRLRRRRRRSPSRGGRPARTAAGRRCGSARSPSRRGAASPTTGIARVPFDRYSTTCVSPLRSV